MKSLTGAHLPLTGLKGELIFNNKDCLIAPGKWKATPG